MEVYDYRQELIDLLNNTADDPQSLLQTQRSLTTILNILNKMHHVLFNEKFNRQTSCLRKHAKH